MTFKFRADEIETKDACAGENAGGFEVGFEEAVAGRKVVTERLGAIALKKFQHAFVGVGDITDFGFGDGDHAGAVTLTLVEKRNPFNVVAPEAGAVIHVDCGNLFGREEVEQLLVAGAAFGIVGGAASFGFAEDDGVFVAGGVHGFFETALMDLQVVVAVADERFPQIKNGAANWVWHTKRRNKNEVGRKRLTTSCIID